MNHLNTDSKDAPWNNKELPEEEVKVNVSITLSKTVKVNVNDYKVIENIDENGRYTYCDLSDCDLYKAVEKQVTLPQYLAEFTERMFEYDLNLKAAGMPKYLKDSIEDCKFWHIDNVECNLE